MNRQPVLPWNKHLHHQEVVCVEQADMGEPVDWQISRVRRLLYSSSWLESPRAPQLPKEYTIIRSHIRIIEKKMETTI